MTPPPTDICPCGGIYFVRQYRIGRRVQRCCECDKCKSWIRIDN